MELVEPIDRINYWLMREFGKFSDDRAIWRVILAGEQFEKRVMYHTDEGLALLYPEVREVRKYQHIAKHKYVLERLVPVQGETDIVSATSYEPAWTFEDRKGNYLPPRFDACKFIIEAIYSQQDKANTHVKYKDPEIDPEVRKKKIDDMKAKLFGNETPVGDALAHGFGVTDFNSKVELTSSIEEKGESNVS